MKKINTVFLFMGMYLLSAFMSTKAENPTIYRQDSPLQIIEYVQEPIHPILRGNNGVKTKSIASASLDATKMIAKFTSSKSIGANMTFVLNVSVQDIIRIDWGNGAITEHTLNPSSTGSNISGQKQGDTIRIYADRATEGTFTFNNITYLDIRLWDNLERLNCSDNTLSTLDLSNNTLLKKLYIRSNRLSTIDLSKNTNLQELDLVNNRLSTLDLSKNTMLQRLEIFNNSISSIAGLEVQILSNLKHIDISNNKLIPGSFPASFLTAKYIYTPQKDFEIPSQISSEMKLDLGALYAYKNATPPIIPSIAWVLEDGSRLVENIDYTVDNAGVFTFLKNQTKNAYAKISHNLYPDFTNGNILKTTKTRIAPSPIVPKMIAKFINKKSIGESMSFVLNVSEKDTIRMDWGNGLVIGYPLSPSSTGSYISGQKQGDTIRIYANYATEGDFSGNGVTYLDIRLWDKIEKLTGDNNSLSTLDLSKNTSLRLLNLRYNQLSTLDLSKNTLLKDLGLFTNQLFTIDLSKNTNLEFLNLSYNRLSTLDLSKNTKLDYLDLSHNQLSSILGFDINTLSNLQRISISNNKLIPGSFPASFPSTAEGHFSYAPQQAIAIPSQISSDMKLDLGALYAYKNATPSIIPSIEWVLEDGSKLIENTDYTVDNAGVFTFLRSQKQTASAQISHALYPKFTNENILKTTKTRIAPGPIVPKMIAKFTTTKAIGESIRFGLNVREMDTIRIDWGNGAIDKQLLSPSPTGTSDNISGQKLGDTIRIYACYATEGDFSDNGITYLDIRLWDKIERLTCTYNSLFTLDLTKNTKLTYLDLHSNQLSTLDPSKNTLLESLYLSVNQLSTIDLSKNTKLKYLYLGDNPLSTLDLSKNTNLENLHLANNSLSSIVGFDTHTLSNLQSINISNNKLIPGSFPVSFPKASLYTYAPQEAIAIPALIPSDMKLDLGLLYAYRNANPSIIPSIAWVLEDDSTLVENKDYTVDNAGVFTFLKSQKQIASAQISYALYPQFKSEKILKTTKISIASAPIAPTMIAKFTSTKSIGESMAFVLNVSEKDTIRMDWGNGTIDKHPLSPSSTGSNISGTKQGDTIRIYAYSATIGDFSGNGITYLDIRLWNKIERLTCTNSLLSTLDLTKNTKLTYLDLYSNQLSTLDPSKNTLLESLYLSVNQLSTIDLSKNTKLKYLYLGDNPLSTLDLSKNTNLENLHLANNSLSSIVGFDTHTLSNLQSINISNNKLIPGSFPASFPNASYTYAPQKAIAIPSLIPSDMKLDLGVLYTYKDANPSIIPSIAWVLEDDSTLVENKDYTVDNAGVFTFLKSQTRIASAQISYALYPDFTNENILKTTSISIASAPIVPKMIAKFTSTKSIGERMEFDLAVNAKDTIQIDWGNGILDKHLLRPAPKGSTISGTKQGDTIRIYAYSAVGCGFTNNGITSLDVHLWDKMELLDCNGNLLPTLDLSKNTKLEFLFLTNNQLSTMDLSKNTLLSILYLDSNQLSTLDLSKNTKLTYLNLRDNPLSTIDLSKNSNLQGLCFDNNALSTLDLSKNTMLKELYLDNNALSTLDLSKNTMLKELSLANNSLSSIVGLDSNTLSNLQSIDISNNKLIPGSFPASFPKASFYTYAPQKTIAIPALIPSDMKLDLGSLYAYRNANPSIIPSIAWVLENDSTLVEKQDYTVDSLGMFTFLKSQTRIASAQISYALYPDFTNENILKTTGISIASAPIVPKMIAKFTGTESIGESMGFDLAVNAKDTIQIDWGDGVIEKHFISSSGGGHFWGQKQGDTIRIYAYSATYGDFSDNGITYLDIRLWDNIEELDCSGSLLSTLDLSKNTQLTYLSLSNNQLSTLDLSKNTKLTDLSLGRNQLSTLDLSKNTKLTDLKCYENLLSTIDLSKNTELTYLDLDDNQLSTIDLSKNTLLGTLYIDNSQLSTLDLSKNTMLSDLTLANNSLSSILGFDTNTLSNLQFIDISNNKLIPGSFPASFPNAWYTYAPQKAIAIPDLIPSDMKLDLGLLYAYRNANPSIIPSITWVLVDGSPLIEDIDYTLDSLGMFTFLKSQTQTASAQISYALYPQFKREKILRTTKISIASDLIATKMIAKFTSDKSIGERIGFSLQVSAMDTIQIDWGDGVIEKHFITSSDGGPFFGQKQGDTIRVYACYATDGFFPPNDITYLDISLWDKIGSLYCFKNSLSTLDLSKNTKLMKLVLRYNQLSTLDLSKDTNLAFLDLSYNQLSTLDLSKDTNLAFLDLSNNQLSALDLSKNTKLTELSLDNNQLSALDLSKNTELWSLYLSNNQLSTLDLSKNTNLRTAILDSNQLSTLDLSKNTKLENLYLSSNQLSTLDLSKNTNLENLDLSYNQLSALDLSKNTMLTELSLANNSLSSIVGLDPNTLSNLSQIDISNNKLIPGSFPTSFPYASYTYAPQKALTIPALIPSDMKLDLGFLYAYRNASPSIIPNITWALMDGSPLIEKQDYSVDSLGVFTFLKNQTQIAFAQISHPLYPDFRNGNILKTTGISIASDLIVPTMIAKFTSSKSIGEKIEFELRVRGDMDTISVDWGNGVIDKYLLSSSSTAIKISGQKKGDTILVYAYSAAKGNFSNNGIMSLDIHLWDKISQLECHDNLLSTLDLSKNTKLLYLGLYNNQLSTLDLSKDTNLTYLSLSNNQLSALDLSKNTKLTDLNLDDNPLSTLDLSKNTLLKTLYIDNSQLSTLDLSKNTMLSDLTLANNSLSSIVGLDPSTLSNLSQIDISNNKLIPGSFPASFPNARYTYAPQKAITIPALIPSDMKLDLGALYAYRNENPSIIPNITWVLMDGSPLIEKQDYSVDSLGVFTFLKSQTQIASAQISYALYPDFINEDILRTTSISIASAPIAPTMIAKFTSSKSIGERIEFGLYVRGDMDTISVDWGNGIIDKHLLSSSATGSNISGQKRGDTILVYAYSAEAGNFSNNDITSLDISLWDKIEKLDCYENLLSTIDLSKNTKLTELVLFNNQLSTLDLSKNTNLRTLYLSSNQLSTIDLSKDTNLTDLSLSNNQLSTLDLSKNTNLTDLSLSNNQLSTLDLSKNTELTYLYLGRNQLSTLDLSKNTNLRTLNLSNNFLSSILGFNTHTLSNLQSINISNNKLIPGSFPVDFPNAWNYTYAPQKAITIPALIPSNMKLDLGHLYAYRKSNPSVIPSIAWVLEDGSKLIEKQDYTVDSLGVFTFLKSQTQTACAQISYVLYPDFRNENILRTTRISIASAPIAPQMIAKFTTTKAIGESIQFGLNVRDMDTIGIDWGNGVIDKHFLIHSYRGDGISGQKLGDTIRIYAYSTTEGDFSENGITSLDIRLWDKIEKLECYDNLLSTIDLSKNTQLTYLNLGRNQLSSLDLSKDTNLTYLNLGRNQLSSLDLSKNTKLTHLDLDNNQLSTLDLSKNIMLTDLYLSNNFLSRIIGLDSRTLSHLDDIDIRNNKLIPGSFPVDFPNAWNYTYAPQKAIAIPSLIPSNMKLDLGLLYAYRNKWPSVIPSITWVLEDGSKLVENQDYTVNFLGMFTFLKSQTQTASAQISYALYPQFKREKILRTTRISIASALIAPTMIAKFTSTKSLGDTLNLMLNVSVEDTIRIDWGNGVIDKHLLSPFSMGGHISGTKQGDTIRIYAYSATAGDFSENGITYLDIRLWDKIESLECFNNLLSTIDLSKNTKLGKLDLTDNQLSTMDLSKNTNLENLDLDNNPLFTLDLSKNTKLDYLSLDNNPLSTLDLSKNTKLDYLSLFNNPLSTLDLSKNTKLTELVLSNNPLSTLDLSKNTELTYLDLDDNQLSTLDLSKNTKLYYLHLSNNQLSSILGFDINTLSNLQYINISNNKLIPGSFPVDFPNASYTYAPQKAITIPSLIPSNMKLNLGLLYAYRNERPSVIPSIAWVLEDGSKLIENQDYTVNSLGMFTFLKSQTQIASAQISYALYPDFKNENILKTTKISIASAPIAPTMIAKFTSTKSIGESMTFVLNVSEKDTIRMDWGNGTIDKHPLSPSFTGSSISGQKQGDTIRIYAYSATAGDFTNNDITYLDIRLWDKIESLNCNENLLSTLDLSKNTLLQELYIDSNQLSILDLSKNTNLSFLALSNNRISTLDLSKNTKLEVLALSNNRISTLDLSKNTGLYILYLDNNSLSDVLGLNFNTHSDLEQIDISNNKLIPGSFPISFQNARSYIYAPQKVITIPSLIPSDMKLDLGLLYAYRNANPSIIPNITWVLEDGSTLIENIDYRVDKAGVFTFLKSQTRIASAQISYALYPDFKNENILRTTSISIASAPIVPTMIAKFTSTKSIGESMAFVLNVSEKDTIRMDWGNGTIDKHPLSPSSTGSNISGKKQGDTIRIYAYSATAGDFTNNDITYLDIRLWDKIESLNCNENLLPTIDLSKNTKLTYLDLRSNKFNISSLPSLRKGTTYFYFPQKPEGILLPQTINMADTLDLSYYASTLDSAGIEQKSKFTWYIENADLTLQALTNKDYQTMENAKFIFNRSGNLKCYVQNAAFPASTVPSNQGFTGFESTLVHVSPSIPDTIRFVVRITPAQNGSFTVKNGSKTIHNGDLVDSNTHLQLVAIPEKGYVFDQWWDKDTLATKEYILKSSVSISALFKKGLAVEEEQGKLNIRTYTNNQIIYIELPGEESYLVEIYDLQGRRIHFQKNAMHTINFPVNSRGIYILRVRNATEKWVQKIIVS